MTLICYDNSQLIICGFAAIYSYTRNVVMLNWAYLFHILIGYTYMSISDLIFVLSYDETKSGF